MANAPAEVLTFLNQLANRALPNAKRDRAELETFAADALGLLTLEPWDLTYVSQKLMQARYSFSQQEVKPYFPLDQVLSGLFSLITALYGLTVGPDDAPVWHPDVRFFKLTDASGTLVGQFYLDPFAREGKRGGAWMNGVRSRRAVTDSIQTPVVYLVCNFGRGAGSRPATLTHNDIITLFHEMGHGLHHLLSEVDEVRLSGVNGVEWDAVELPSQFMENFCWEWERLRDMSGHIDSGELLPRALFDKMLAARHFQSGMQMMRQIELSMFDMELHTSFAAGGDILGLLKQIRAKVAVNPALESDRFPHYFSHIFSGGYAAGYYSYKWAEVLSADAYSAFEGAPHLIGETGDRFRREVLAPGGSRRAIENFRAFLGRDPDISALLRHSGLAA
jgi:oligopeptidase A